MNVSNDKTLGWEDYPEPKIRAVRGALVVEVSIPRPIRHLFGSGNGKTNNRRLTTGTTDPAIAQRKMWTLAHEIYKQFDQAQIDVQQRQNDQTDAFALDTISTLAVSLNYNRGNLPELSTKTPFADLKKLKDALDYYRGIFHDQAPPAEISLAALNVVKDAINNGTDPVEAKKKAMAIYGDLGPFTAKQSALLSRNASSIVQSYWEDLLTTAAIEQGVTVPVFEPRPDARWVKHDGSYLPEGIVPGAKVVERPRRIQSVGPRRISDIKNDYFAFLESKHDKINTRRKWSRAVDRFVDLMGDLPLQDIKPMLAYAFAQKQCDNNHDVSNANIKDYHTGVSLMLKYCVRRGYIEVNTFQGIGMKEYGKTSQPWLPFTLQELHNIFDYNWGEQERLLLSIVATTGMRLTEAGMLTWERFNDTEIKGVRYFSLIDTEDEQVTIKNQGSSRHVPLHPKLILPPKGTGRLFDYTVDDNGLCSSSAGHVINPTLDKLAPHKRKSAHSFRRTLKVMLRDAGVSREINNIYTGHGEGDVAGKSYGGASIQTRYDAIAKLDVSWLK